MAATEVQQVRALGLVSCRRNLLTWSAENGEETHRESKWIVDSDSSEAETPNEEQEMEIDSKITHQMEELDYLALDLVTVLPGERVHRLLETLRQQDSIMHDLLCRAKTLYKENKILKQKETHAAKKMPIWALPLPGETPRCKKFEMTPLNTARSAAGTEAEGSGSDVERYAGKKMRKSRSAVANLICNRSHKETFAEKHKSIRAETKFLERLEWAMKVNNGNDGSTGREEGEDAPQEEKEEKAKADLCAATASSRSTSASCDEEPKFESLQATVRELTETNNKLTETNQRLQAHLETTLMELGVRTEALKTATDEIGRLKAPRTYNLRLTPARYRGGSMALPIGEPETPTSSRLAGASPAGTESTPRFESSPSQIPKLDHAAMAAAAAALQK